MVQSSRVSQSVSQNLFVFNVHSKDTSCPLDTCLLPVASAEESVKCGAESKEKRKKTKN